MREMVLHDESSRAGGESILAALEKRPGSRAGDRFNHRPQQWIGAAGLVANVAVFRLAHPEDAQDVPLAIDHADDLLWTGLRGGGGENVLNIPLRERLRRRENAEQPALFQLLKMSLISHASPGLS